MDKVKVKILHERLNLFFQKKVSISNFIKCLIANNAVIAGGFITSLYADFQSNNIDIFVNLDHVEKLVDDILRLFNDKFEYTNEIHFMHKFEDPRNFQNNIAFVYHVFLNNKPDIITSNWLKQMRSSKSNVKIFVTTTSIEQVIDAFDLSCCKAWFDGTTIFTKTLKKQYTLSPHLNLLNKYVNYRVKKYLQRGFSIVLHVPKTISIDSFSSKQDAIFDELWMSKFLIQQFLFKSAKETSSSKRFFKKLLAYFRAYEKKVFTFSSDPTKHMNIVLGIYVDFLYWHPTPTQQSLGANKHYISYKNCFYRELRPHESSEILDIRTSECITSDDIELIQKFYPLYPCHFKYVEILAKIDDDQRPKRFIHTTLLQFNVLQPLGSGASVPYNVIVHRNQGFDPIMYDNNVDMTTYLAEDDCNLVFIKPDQTFICMSKDTLNQLVMNVEVYMYECSGKTFANGDKPIQAKDYMDPFIGIPFDVTGMNAFVSIGQVLTVLTMKTQLFYLNHIGSVTHSASYKVLFDKNPNYVSANHCQAGSNLITYDIMIVENNRLKIK